MSIPAMQGMRSYRGPERRRNHVLVTQNREYHVHDDRCVAVRDRKTHQFVPDHPALGKQLTGGMKTRDGDILGVSPPDSLEPGERICFSARDGRIDKDVLTSALVGIERPPKEVIASYPGILH